MVGLLSLSNELLVQVFSSSDTIKSAATLSRVNKTMHSLWATHINPTLTNILPTEIIAYKDAKELAILEEIWFHKNAKLASKTSGRPRVYLYLFTLLDNAKLAASATATRYAFLEEKHQRRYDTTRADVASCHVAYYRMRKIVLGQLLPEAQLQHVLHSTINTFSEEDNLTLAKFNVFLSREDIRYQSSVIDQARTGAEGEEPARHEFALLHGSVLADHFGYVCDALNVWREDMFRTYNEKTDDSILAIQTSGEELRASILAVQTSGEKLPKSVHRVLVEKRKLIEKSILEVKTRVKKIQKRTQAWRTDEFE
jgi:hypothetical protein